jgi:photosystem II stability/assembly factor-like uncharacterized protein
VFRSKGGATWEPAGTGAAGAVTSLELSGMHTVGVLTAQGAFASLDSGATWKTCGIPAPRAVWYGLAFDAAANGTALAATSAGLFRSTDNCESWTSVDSGLQAATVSVVLFHPTKPREAFATQDGRIFESMDGGQRWFPMDEERTWPSALLVLPDSPSRLFALLPRRGVASKEIGLEQ